MQSANLSINSFYSLVAERATESSTMEFKKFSFPDGKVNTEQKEKLEKEIAAFANAEGGIIYIGIDESKDKVASAIVGVGCGIEKFDDIQLAIQSRLLAKVHPRIYGITMQAFSLSDNDMVIAISVPKSISRPHAVNDGNKDNFYIRHSNGITNMSLDDLRREILTGASYQNDIRRFRQDRIGMILSNEYIRQLQDGAKIVLHIIPIWSLEFGNLIDYSLLDSWTGRDPFRPFTDNGIYSAFCADGKISFSCPYNETYVRSSILLTRSGILEAVDAHRMNYRTDLKMTYLWTDIEKVIYQKITEYAALLEKLDIPKPWYVSISIVNGKGYRTYCNGEESEALHSNYIQGIDVIWNEGQSQKEVLKPSFDSIANAFGIPETQLDFDKL